MSEQTETTTPETEPKKRGRKPKVTAKLLARAHQMASEKNWSTAQIAKQTWCTVGAATLQRYLSGAQDFEGVSYEVEGRRPGQKGPTAEMRERIVALAHEGMNLTQIQKKTKRGDRKFALPTLSKIVKGAGIEVRAGRPPMPKDETPEAEATA